MSPVASVIEALAKCAVTRTWTVNMCGQFCAAMFGYGSSGYHDAVAQWNAIPATERHPGDTNAPPGSLLFWGTGNGHVAVSDGFGSCWSIDISGPGTVTFVPASMISARWGKPYLGWTTPYFQGSRWNPVSIYGIDVSMFQPINFLLTTPGDNKPVSFAIIKVTEGASWLSSRWTGQRQWSRDHSLSTGFYHFARPGDMIAQADRFLNTIGDLQPGEHLWLDWEDAGVTSAQKDAWISYVQGRAPGHRVGLYCNTSFWLNRDQSGFAGDGLWIATGGIPAGQPPIKSNWLIHQYATTGNYDHNLAQFATRADMITWAEGDDMALTAAELKLLKETHDAVVGITSLTDAKVHNAGFYLAHGQQDQAATLKQSQTNGGSLTALKTALTDANKKIDTVAAVLSTLDLSQLPAAIAAKIEKLRLVVTVTEEV